MRLPECSFNILPTLCECCIIFVTRASRIFYCEGIFALALLDVSVIRLLSPKSRYFALHACANAVATVAAFPDVVRGFTEPEVSWSGPSQTMVANSAISAIHIYHCLAFKLSTSDIVHHLVFVSVLCGLGIAFKDKGGIANNFGCFFLSGLPGGLDYILLVRVFTCTTSNVD